MRGEANEEGRLLVREPKAFLDLGVIKKRFELEGMGWALSKESCDVEVWCKTHNSSRSNRPGFRKGSQLILLWAA